MNRSNLVQVDQLGTGRQGSSGSKVAALAAHHLDDIQSSVADGRLLDLIDGIHNLADGRVGADADISARQIVRDGGRQTHDRNVGEDRILAALVVQVQHAVVTTPATDHHDGLRSRTMMGGVPMSFDHRSSIIVERRSILSRYIPQCAVQ